MLGYEPGKLVKPGRNPKLSPTQNQSRSAESAFETMLNLSEGTLPFKAKPEVGLKVELDLSLPAQGNINICRCQYSNPRNVVSLIGRPAP